MKLYIIKSMHLPRQSTQREDIPELKLSHTQISKRTRAYITRKGDKGIVK